MAAKWSLSPSEAHDKQTFICTSTAEALFSIDEVYPKGKNRADRVIGRKHTRMALRTKILYSLRKQLVL